MEDRCICCGANVSDLSTQVCDSCFDRTEKLLNHSKFKMSKVEKLYRECWKRLLYRNRDKDDFT